MTSKAVVQIQKIGYQGWENCYQVSNGEIELVATADVGPRIMRCAFLGGQNLFKEFPEQMGRSGEEHFQLRGGHRLWKAPEDPIASYASDNVPIEIEIRPTGLIAREPVEPSTGLQKEIEIRMEALGTSVRVCNRIRNRTLFPLEFSAWALTVMAPGGIAVARFPPRGDHPACLEATNPLVMWAYTNLGDPRWKFTRKYLTLRQDPNNRLPQKIGSFSPNTWMAYVLNGEAFIKRSKSDLSKPYPDFGCSFELFTNHELLELESLSPITKLFSGEAVELVEDWKLVRNVEIKGLTDDELDNCLEPLVRSV